MKTILFSLIASVFLLSACTSPKNETDRSSETETTPAEATETTPTTGKPVETAPIPASIVHTPYVIQDSSNVMELDGGVKLYFIEKGDGPIPSDLNQMIEAHYHGMLADGKVFQSSFERGVPLKFPLSNVIKGWQTGLTRSPVGSKIKLVIPPNMGYGNIPRPGIPANSTLVFDVEVISLK